ncbi:metal ABC transporter permease [Spiribacter halobius]|uniref:ABC transporter n=1 Tax=Sediminicurvatus halobius TaxID=2182432 RepID=A0A2U2MY12_9GAMM|nr:metal ABC transporter permease [Spiribacter halobius]PWG61564.1 ABC transporter [Spiribacter halobius]UEX77132.1 metal ABC transporter permease [Spiribacter halobius]
MTALLELIGDYTIQNVALGAALLGIVSGALGCFAVLREQSLLGDTLSHAALPGVCLGFLVAGGRELGSILAGALLTGVLAALAMLALVRMTRLKTDAALGIALSLSFAAGVVLLTYIQGTGNASQGGLDAFLFGQAAAILRRDLWVMGGITAFALTMVALLWKELKLVTFDPEFAGVIGLPVRLLDALLTVMVALAIVVGLQMVGVVLMAAMVIAPAVAARQWARSLGIMVIVAALMGVAAGVFGAVVSALGRGLATGPLVVLSASAITLVSLLIAPGRGLLWGLHRRLAFRRRLSQEAVLLTLYRLASAHEDPHYPTEQGAVDAYHGVGTRRSLQALARRGLVRSCQHMREEGAHWVLTRRGRSRAKYLQAGGDLARDGG